MMIKKLIPLLTLFYLLIPSLSRAGEVAFLKCRDASPKKPLSEKKFLITLYADRDIYLSDSKKLKTVTAHFTGTAFREWGESTDAGAITFRADSNGNNIFDIDRLETVILGQAVTRFIIKGAPWPVTVGESIVGEYILLSEKITLPLKCEGLIGGA